MASSRGRWASPERTVVWTEPQPKTSSTARRAGAAPQPTKVAVVYYLSRNGQLDHPHFMEVAVPSPQDGLCLRDVLDRLNVLRGPSMADAYSWSSKRSYKNGYVWHDLTADDPVHPANGNEYVLKGSELLRLPLPPQRPRDGSASSSSSTSSCKQSKNRPPAASGRAARRKNWSSFDLGEYRVAAAMQMGAADSATQTDERRNGRRGRNALAPEEQAARTELGIDEISPPPSSSSPETLETLIEHDARLAAASAAAIAAQSTETGRRGDDVGVISGGRMRASAVLMQIISCGSIPAPAKRDGAAARYAAAERRLPRGRSDLSSSTCTAADRFSGSIGVGMEREYFSGSLVETKMTASEDGVGVAGELGALKRSSSYNADRERDMNMMNTSAAGCRKLELAEEEVDGVRCIPAARKPNSNKKSPKNHLHVSTMRSGKQLHSLQKRSAATQQEIWGSPVRQIDAAALARTVEAALVTVDGELLLPPKRKLLSSPPRAALVVGGGAIRVDADFLNAAPYLRCVVTTAAGLDHVDLAQCVRRGILVAGAGETFSADVADHAVGLIVDVLRRVSAADRYVRRGLWSIQGDYPLGSKVNTSGQFVGLAEMVCPVDFSKTSGLVVYLSSDRL